MPKAVVAEIVGLYRDAGVTPYAGGILFEYAARKGQITEYVAHLKSVGLTTAEISENYVSFEDDERDAYIERLQKAGIEVIYEFGSKNPTDALDPGQLEAIIRRSVERGVRHVILEQSEIDCLREQAPERLPELVAQPWFERVMIEADPYAFPAQHAGLLRAYGSDINLANIAAGQALRLEGMRRGIGRSVNYAMFEGLG